MVQCGTVWLGDGITTGRGEGWRRPRSPYLFPPSFLGHALASFRCRPLCNLACVTVSFVPCEIERAGKAIECVCRDSMGVENACREYGNVCVCAGKGGRRKGNGEVRLRLLLFLLLAFFSFCERLDEVLAARFDAAALACLHVRASCRLSAIGGSGHRHASRPGIGADIAYVSL